MADFIRDVGPEKVWDRHQLYENTCPNIINVSDHNDVQNVLTCSQMFYNFRLCFDVLALLFQIKYIGMENVLHMTCRAAPHLFSYIYIYIYMDVIPDNNMK